MENQRIIGSALILISAAVLFIVRVFSTAPLYEPFLDLVFIYLLTLSLPGTLIDFMFSQLESGKDIARKCGGLKAGGYLIGYTERTLVYLAFLIAYYDAELSFSSILSFLSVIVAAKAIFRYSSRDTTYRECADWYILGTLMSITMGLAFSWMGFRFLLIG
ncbi:MAG: hypothetical protein R6V83_13675 [Candidatus Thorarchaeota archaeon]